MKKFLQFLAMLLALLSVYNTSYSQTSWTGLTSTNWATATNWTAGVPLATTDVMVGDANFTGAYQPAISATAAAKSLTIGGTVLAQLTVAKTLTVKGNVNILSNGTLINGSASISLSGNWVNSGTYSTTSTSASVIFNGLVQSVGGSVQTTFRKLTINTGSIVTLTTDINCSGASSLLSVSGTLNPNELPSYLTTADNLTVNSSGVLKVNAALFASNYVISTAFLLSSGSIVEYSATLLNQTISSSYTYSTLRISGAGTVKTLVSDLPALRSTSSTGGNIYVVSGKLDIGGFAANRGTTVAGGTMSVSNGAFLNIGVTAGFPANYLTNTFGLTSTTEYYGTDQPVSARTYGNLLLTSSAGAAIKTMPATAFTVTGSFTSNVGAGSSVSYTAASNISVTGTMNIGPSTTFNGAAFSHSVTGNWNNTGTFIPGTSTLTLKGTNSFITGNASQEFNNLTITALNITTPGISNISISGNLATSGSGSFRQSSPATLTMTGTTKTITGTGIILDNLDIPGTVTTTSVATITGNITVSGSFIASPGTSTITMNGIGKTITNNGTLTFNSLVVSGAVSTISNFSLSYILNCSGSFLASAGTITFAGTCTITGTVNLCNITINGFSLTLSANAVFGLSGAFNLIAGPFNATSYTPNTVVYNGTGAQTVRGTSYNNLILSNGGTKTAGAAITVNNVLTISPATTFDAVNFTHTIVKNWVNNGTFTAGTSTVQFTGSASSTVSGNTTFNNITVNKSLTTYGVSLQSNVNVSTINMTKGSVNTGSNTLTITTTRTGNDFIFGTITRTHAFVSAIAYAFEGPNNLITFAAGVSGVTSVTVNVTVAAVTDFPYNGSIGREYNVTIPSGSYTATLRLHYEDAELNGNVESVMQLWKHTGAAWAVSGKTANSTTSNYVEKNTLTNINGRWTITDDGSVFGWNGSVSSDWNTAANWTFITGTPGGVPTSTDIAQVGFMPFTNPPTITTVNSVKNITFGSVQASTLTLNSGGALTVNGSISGSWSSNATHTINVNNQTVTVNGDLSLSDNAANHAINLNIAIGTVSVLGVLTQSGGANIIFTGAGTLNIGKDFVYTDGTFTPGTGLVKYNGTVSQVVASVPYNNLTVIKTAGTIAALSNASSLTGSLVVTTGEFDITNTLTVNGSVTISTGALFDANASTINVGGNWSKSPTGTFNAGTGTVTFNGAGTQTISAGAFNILNINKSAGTAVLSGNNTVNGNLSLLAGTLSLATYTLNQSTAGAIFTVANGSTLLVPGANNFPSGFTSYAIGINSLVNYNGTIAQSVAAVTYGNISFTNGGALGKTFLGSSVINGNINIISGATLYGSSFTITLGGDWNNYGNFIDSTGTIICVGGISGANKSINGSTTFYNVIITGFYATTPGTNVIFLGDFELAGFADWGFSNKTFYGNIRMSGVGSDDGITNIMGTRLQYLYYTGTFYSPNYSSSVIYKGTIAPVLQSTSLPTFINLEISNTDPLGVFGSVGITVLGTFLVSPGCTWNGGNLNHTFKGAFVNNGTIISSGKLTFAPGPPLTNTPINTVHIGSGSTFQSTGIVEFGGASELIIDGAPASFNNVMISNTNSAGITPVSNWNMTGKFSVNSNSIFNAGNYLHTVGGNIESDGILHGNTSTFTMSSSNGQISGSPGTVFHNFTITGNITSNSDFSVANDFMNNGTYDGSVGAVIITGSNPSIIGGTTTPSAIAQLTISKAGGAVATLNVNINSLSTLIINSGTLSTSTFSIFQNAGGGALIILPGATLKLGGTNTLPAFSGYGLDVESTVDYAGTTQTIANGVIYGNVTISAAGNKTTPSFLPLTIGGNFTITAGNFVANNNTHNLAGNWTMTGGTFNKTNSVIRFNGTGEQFIQAIAPFNDITISKISGAVTLNSDVTVDAILRFTSGKIKTGDYKVILPSTGTVTGAAQSTGWIDGNLQKYVTAGVITKTFQIGDNNYYTPASIAFGNVTTAGNLSARSLPNDHPNISSSRINATKTVNRHWDFINNGIVFTNYDATLKFPVTNIDAGALSSLFSVSLYTGSSWLLPVTGLVSDTSASATGITAFGDFAIGEVCNRNTAILYTASPYCTASGTATVSRTGSSGGTYSSSPGLAIDPFSGAVTLGTSIPGSYIVTYHIAATGECALYDTSTIITIHESPAPSTSGGDQTVCSDGNPMQTITATAVSPNTIIWYDAAIGGSIVTPSKTGIGTVIFYAEAYNGNCSSPSRTAVTLKIKAVLGTPSSISGPTNVCPMIGSPIATTYFITAVPGATFYTWQVPLGATLVSGQGTTSIGVTFDDSFALTNSMFIVEAGSSSACTSEPSKLEVLKNIPGMPVVINGPANVCSFIGQPTTAVYTIAPVLNATSYTWAVPGGATIISGQGTTSIEVNYLSSFTSGSIQVTANSNCGNRVPRSLNLYKLMPGTPSAITGTTNSCPYIGTGTPVSYSISAVPNATSYTWTVPANVTLVSGQGTTAITVTFNSGYVTSLIKVKSVVNCGVSGDRSLSVAASLYKMPGIISGAVNACTFIGAANEATYTIRKVLNAASYIWSVPAGATIASHPGGAGINDTSITVVFDNNFISGSQIFVQAGGCVPSAARGFIVTRVVAPLPGVISGPTNVCPFAISAGNPSGITATYSIRKIVNAQSYLWSVPAGATVTAHPGGAGLNDTIVQVIFDSIFTAGTIRIRAVNGCGASAERSLSISKFAPGTPCIINVMQIDSCPNKMYTYSLATMPTNATSILWTIPAGATLISGQGTVNITVAYPPTNVSGTITARPYNNCASGSARSININLKACLPGYSRGENYNLNTNEKFSRIEETWKVKIFPNPTISDFKLEVLSAGKEIIRVRILDFQGQELKNMIITPNETTSFGNELKTGAYLIEVTQGQNKTIQRLLKF